MISISLNNLRIEMEKKSILREEIIAISRVIQGNSKKAIYEIHRGNLANALKLLTNAEKDITKTRKKAINYHGSFNAALEEYVEAKLFYEFVTKKPLSSAAKLKVTAETYLGALSDLTGELHRLLVLKGTNKDIKAVKEIRDLIDAIFGELQQFDFPNSDLRRKFDQIKYNLQKAEQVMYDLSR